MDFSNLFDGKFRLIRLLGSGGCGRVYLAENIRTKSLWAIKEIPCDTSNLQQVEREIDVLKKVRHPALPRIVDVLHENGMFYLIEDYFEGRNVEEILRERKFINAGAAIKWALEICDIMIFLHGQAPEPIIYRDLKPSNIILSPEGSIRLVDFGSVRRYKSDSPSDTVYIGTRGYAAPEQYGLGQTSEQTDVYSFGVTMMQILTGKRPMSASFYGHGMGDDCGGSGGCGGGGGSGGCGGGGRDIRFIPKQIIAILSKCTECDPARRYNNFHEIKNELINVQSNIKPAADRRGCAPSEEPVLALPRPLGVYRCVTISVTQNHEFAFELASRICERYGLKTLILDCDFESTLSELYFTYEKSDNFLLERNSLFHAVKLIEKATYATHCSTNAINDNTTSYLADLHTSNDKQHRFEGEHEIYDGLPGIFPYNSSQPEPLWLNEPNPEYSGLLADKFIHNNGLLLRRFLAEITVFVDVCIILTGQSIFSELNMRCFQNSHYILCPGRVETQSIKTFNNTAILGERFKSIPSSRFKYIIWGYEQNDEGNDVIYELRDESLAGAVRKSKRREGARRGGVYNGCYAYAMDRAVKKDYDGIINALGIVK